MPCPHMSGYFWIRKFFFPIQKFPRLHVPYSNRIQDLAWYPGLLCNKMSSKISGFTHPRVVGSVADFFPSQENGFKNIRIRCRIRRMRVDGSCIRKEKKWGLKNIPIRVDGTCVKSSKTMLIKNAYPNLLHGYDFLELLMSLRTKHDWLVFLWCYQFKLYPCHMYPCHMQRK